MSHAGRVSFSSSGNSTNSKVVTAVQTVLMADLFEEAGEDICELVTRNWYKATFIVPRVNNRVLFTLDSTGGTIEV